MGSSALDHLENETVSILWQPTPERRSYASRDSASADQDSWDWDCGQDGTIPILWQPSARPCSSIYSVDSSSLGEPTEGLNESVKVSPLDVTGRRTDGSTPVPGLPSARPCSSIYSVDISPLDELAERVDESVKATLLDTIARLTQENSALQDELILYRRIWHGFMRLFDRVLGLALRIRGIIEEYDGEITAAEGAWLAHWGIGCI